MKKIKRCMLFLMSAVLSLSAVVGAGCANNGVNSNSNKVVPQFNGGEQFKIFADRPPTPNEKHLSVYKDAGFNYYVMTEDDYEFTDDKGNITAKYAEGLNVCDELGLKVLVRNFRDDPDYFVNPTGGIKTNKDYLGNYISYFLPERNITTQLQSFPAVAGYYMADEPTYTKISELTKLVDWYNSYGNNTLFHINMTGSVLGTGLMEGHSYSEFITHYADTILKKVNGPKTLSVDFYPLMEESDGDKYLQKEILSDYMVIANKVKELNANLSGDNKVITNYCMQTFYSDAAGWGWRDLVAENDVTFQTYLATAFGAKAFEYYMYRGMNSDTAIVEALSQDPRPMYYWVQSANAEMQEFAPVILPFEWNGVRAYEGKQLGDPMNAQAFELIKDCQLEKFTFISDVYARLDTLVSEHFDEDGNKAYLVMNYTEPTFNQTNYVTLTLNGAKQAVIYNAVEVEENGKTVAKLTRSVIDVVDGQIDLQILSGRAAFVYPVV